MTQHSRPSQFRKAHRRSASAGAIASLLFAACAAWSGSAFAQELNGAGHLVFGAERLFGFYLDKQNYDAGQFDRDEDTTVVGLGWTFTNPSALLTLPRVGVDYFIDEHLTVGGNFGIASISGDGPEAIGLLLAGRVGYALRISNAISFWPRGGLTFAMADGDGDANLTTFGLTIEGMFTLAPSDGWAVLAGPLLDLGFLGGAGDNVDHSEILFGIMIGLTGWLEV